MHMHRLNRTVSNISCSQKISFHAFIFLTVLYLYVTSGELEWFTLTTGQGHIIETHFKITYNSSNIF